MPGHGYQFLVVGNTPCEIPARSAEALPDHNDARLVLALNRPHALRKGPPFIRTPIIVHR